MTKRTEFRLPTIEEMDRELIARGAQATGEERFGFADKDGTPQRDAIMSQMKALYEAPRSTVSHLSYVDTEGLVKKLLIETRSLNNDRGIRGKDSRMDFHEINDQHIKRNACSVAAVCSSRDLTNDGNGFFTLRTKNYGKVFNLCRMEPFQMQPIAAGPMFTGFLVSEDIIATAGHCINDEELENLRVIFGFRTTNDAAPVSKIPVEDVFQCTKLVAKRYNRETGEDWALLKLKLNGCTSKHPTATLSKSDIPLNQQVYIIGYPCGLPLKFAPGAQVGTIDDVFFSADLDIYSGNSGSPVFRSDTHEVIGIVVRGDNQDFRWTGKCWVSIIYSKSGIKSKDPQCTKVSQFLPFCI